MHIREKTKWDRRKGTDMERYWQCKSKQASYWAIFKLYSYSRCIKISFLQAWKLTLRTDHNSVKIGHLLLTAHSAMFSLTIYHCFKLKAFFSLNISAHTHFFLSQSYHEALAGLKRTKYQASLELSLVYDPVSKHFRTLYFSKIFK